MKQDNPEQKSANIQQQIGYQGNVSISFVKNGKIKKSIKQHNSGTSYLFQLLASAITGQSLASEMPRYIMLFDASDNPILYYKPQFTGGKPIVSDGQARASFTAYIPQSAVTASTFKKLAMYTQSNNPNTKLAEVTLENPTEIPTGYSVMVTWEMLFTNV